MNFAKFGCRTRHVVPTTGARACEMKESEEDFQPVKDEDDGKRVHED